MNIMINTYCNLKCPYCFADPTMKACEVQNMSLTSFKVCLNWLKREGTPQVRLIGGEPTVFPQLEEFLDTIISYRCFKEVLIFSNFTFDQKMADMLLEKMKYIEIHFLPNINEFDLLIPKYKENILRNIDFFMQNCPYFSSLGINVYRPDMDFSQWEEIIAKYPGRFNHFRYCIAIPTKAIVENNFDFYEYYSQFDDALNRLLDIGEKYNVAIGDDCNNVPPCCFKDSTIARIYKISPTMLAQGNLEDCGYPVIDVRPDLSIAGCFGFNCPAISEKTLKDFANFQELEDWCRRIGDTSDWIARKDCLECGRYRRVGRSCSCKSTHLVNKYSLEKKIR